MKVLFGDDDKIIHRIVAHHLTREGIVVKSAYNGRQVLEMAEEEAPDLLILDGMMPEMDGFATLREWRSRERLRHIPVVMLTAKTRDDDMSSAIEGGAVDYLTKPFSPSELVDRVKQLIGSGTPAPESA